MEGSTVHAQSFYAQYNGHPIYDLTSVHAALRKEGSKIIFLAGDSSLDNKHWLFPPNTEKQWDTLKDDNYTGPALNGYEKILKPARCVKDVCYWLNDAAMGSQFASINCAVEESSIADRANGLLAHDQFICDHLQPDDVVVISLGGNDIALRPSISTLAAMVGLNWLTPQSYIENDSGLGLATLRTLLRDGLAAYIKAITVKTKPRAVLVCMFYYPCETGRGWADKLLDILGYNNDPTKLKAIIDLGFRQCISTISEVVDDVPIVPVALSALLDSTDSADYKSRVEPSVQGSLKIGHGLFDIIVRNK